jgi:hypothetical protein
MVSKKAPWMSWEDCVKFVEWCTFHKVGEELISSEYIATCENAVLEVLRLCNRTIKRVDNIPYLFLAYGYLTSTVTFTVSKENAIRYLGYANEPEFEL